MTEHSRNNIRIAQPSILILLLLPLVLPLLLVLVQLLFLLPTQPLLLILLPLYLPLLAQIVLLASAPRRYKSVYIVKLCSILLSLASSIIVM